MPPSYTEVVLDKRDEICFPCSAKAEFQDRRSGDGPSQTGGRGSGQLGRPGDAEGQSGGQTAESAGGQSPPSALSTSRGQRPPGGSKLARDSGRLPSLRQRESQCGEGFRASSRCDSGAGQGVSGRPVRAGHDRAGLYGEVPTPRSGPFEL